MSNKPFALAPQRLPQVAASLDQPHARTAGESSERAPLVLGQPRLVNALSLESTAAPGEVPAGAPGNEDTAEAARPSEAAMARARRIAETYTAKSGTFLHPDPSVTEGVLLGLGAHIDELKRPLCPCRFYPDKQEEIQHRTWICPCDDMQIYKYCHCLLFTNEEGQPITEHLPAEHEGRRIWGDVRDPDPSKGRALRERTAEREEERRRRKS